MTATASIQQDAKRLSILFDCGAISFSEIIAWTDKQIVKANPPSDALLSLSMTLPEKTADIISLLHQLSVGADYWSAFRASLPQFHEFLLAHPGRSEGIANQFYFITCSSTVSVPSDLNFLYRYDDAFDLARDGAYGTREEVYRDFMRELQKFKPTSADE